MTLPDEIARYLWLRDSGVELPDDPIDLLRRVNDLALRLLPGSLAVENSSLRHQLEQSNHRLSEALGNARVLENKITVLETAAKRQTLVRPHDQQMRRDSSSSSEFGPDLLVDDAFKPCRDERCKLAELHAANSSKCISSRRGPGRKKKDSHA